MKKNISKEIILQVCMQKQEELINNFNNRVIERRADASIANQSTSQSEDRNAGNVEVLDSLEKELVFAQLELSALKAIDPTKKNTTVESGAVVVTNERIFFIAVSSEKVEIDGKVIYGISTNAPIYSVMQGLAKGDRFEFNDTAYDIENVYWYSLIINPVTGYPVTGITSVTVVGPSAEMANSFSTSLIVLGVKAGLKLMGKYPDNKYIMITNNGNVLSYKNLKLQKYRHPWRISG